MTDDERNDRREGYADGMAGHDPQYARGATYYPAWANGATDADMLRNVAEWKRRAALPEPDACA